MRDGAVATLRCPLPDCATHLPPYVLAANLSEEAYAKWEALVLSRSLDAMADIGHCPRCSQRCVLEDDFAQCPSCFFAFCTLCSSSWHPGAECMTAAQRLAVLRKRAESGGVASQKDAEVRRLRTRMCMYSFFHRGMFYQVAWSTHC